MIDKIKITRATSDDMFDLFELANDPEVRKNSFNLEKIDIETHEKWFNNRVDNDDFLLLVARNGVNFIGSIRFEKDIDNKFIISIQIHKNFRGKGLGKKNPIIIAKIKSNNLSSIKIFSDSNFKIIENNQKEQFIVLEYCAKL